MTLEQARKIARRDADRDGKAISICKLNPYASSVVLRQWEPRDEGRWYFVEKVEASQCE